jgi:hypothetical protein
MSSQGDVEPDSSCERRRWTDTFKRGIVCVQRNTQHEEQGIESQEIQEVRKKRGHKKKIV